VIISFARLSLRIAHSRSLKEKRRVVRSIVDKVRSKFDVRISEVGGHDSWQSVDLGFAVVGTNRILLEGIVDRVIQFVDGNAESELVAEDRDSFYYGDDMAATDEGP
jgi:hypothetical protein